MKVTDAHLGALNIDISPPSFPELTHGSDNAPVIHEDLDFRESLCSKFFDFLIFTAIFYYR